MPEVLRARELRYAEALPFIKWTEPLAVKTSNQSALVCRFCVAFYGLKARDLERVGFATREDFDTHLRDKHLDTI